MPVGTISTYAVFQSTLSDVSTIENNVSTLQGQLSSGQVSQNFQGLGSQTPQYLDLQNEISKATLYTNNNNLVATTLTATGNALTQISTAAQGLASLITTQQTGIATGSDFSTQLNSYWQSITAALNTTSNGQYIFSGTRTDAPAVNTTEFPALANNTVNYYQGSDQDLTVRVNDSVSLTYNVRADAPALQQIFSGLAMAAQAGTSSNPSQQYTQAYNLVEQGIQGVTTLQSTVNANQLTITDTNQNLASQNTYWQGVQQNIGNTDLVSASTQLAVDQGILQAAFEAFAKINSLNLAQYLT